MNYYIVRIFIYVMIIDNIMLCSYIIVTRIHLYACFGCSCIHVAWIIVLLYELLLLEYSCITVT